MEKTNSSKVILGTINFIAMNFFLVGCFILFPEATLAVTSLLGCLTYLFLTLSYFGWMLQN